MAKFFFLILCSLNFISAPPSSSIFFRLPLLFSLSPRHLTQPPLSMLIESMHLLSLIAILNLTSILPDDFHASFLNVTECVESS